MMRADVAAIVPSAGAGRRLGRSVGKLFVTLNGRPLLAHTLRALEESPSIRWIVPVVRSAERGRVQALIARYGITKAVAPCVGGASRAESVARGLAAVPPEAGWVLIHDGARPCLSPRLVDAAVRAAGRQGAVACGLPAALTVKAVDARGEVRLTLDREHLWLVQTPQVFRRDWLTEAFARAGRRLAQFPDDAAVLESAGYAVRMIPGDPLNLKVTTRQDLLIAEAVLSVASRNGRGMR